MELKAAIFFLFLYYIRPQDWIGGLAGFNIMRPMIALWAWALFSSHKRSVVSGLFRTPHDWSMLAYFVWIVWTANDAKSALTGFLPLVVFYAFTLHSLTSWERIVDYLKAWNYMLLGVALIALASLMKLDLTGAVDLTARNEGRLCIGTWMHDNPNALGHSIAVVMPLSYLLYFFRGNALGRFFIFPLQSGLALWCIYETQSKGAFLVTGMLMALVFVIGRPLLVRVFVLVTVISLGVSALSFLPRMSDVGNLRADEGVQGRLMAWELAKTAMEQRPAGWKQFVAYINWRGLTERKATHASYVQVGADLGVVGMGFYLLVLWTAFRTTVLAHRLSQDNDEKERGRRALLLLIIAYAASGWMINREYHTEYFLLIAVAAAMHRLCLAENLEDAQAEESHGGSFVEQQAWFAHAQPVQRAGTRTLAYAFPALSQQNNGMPETAGMHPDQASPIAPHLPVWSMEQTTEFQSADSTLEGFWNRVGILDAAVAASSTWGVVYVWEYILKNL